MKTFFPLLYVFCIFSYYLIGQITLPGLPINLNILSIILLLVACVVIEKPRIDKWMKKYFIFLFCFALSALVTGFFGDYFHQLYSSFLMSFVIFWATGILLRHFDTLSPLIYSIIVIGVIDAAVTVLQTYGIPIHNPLLTMVIADTERDEILAAQGYELGVSISGLYTNPVFNGHLLLFFFLVSLIPQYKKFNSLIFVFSLLIYVGVFYCQQRSAFFMSSIALVFVVYNKIKGGKYRFLLFILFLVAVIVVYRYLVDFIVSSGSRLSQVSSTGREEVWAKTYKFLRNNFIFGGYNLCIKQTGVYPHNLILSSFLAGGLIGGIILLMMVFEQVLFIVRKIRLNKNVLYGIVGIMYFCMLFDSMFHNTGLVEMDFSTFIIWGLFSNIMIYEISPSVSIIKGK